MKGKEYFQKLIEQGKLESEDVKKFIETVPDFEMPDPVFAEFEGNFLTRDRAYADSKIRAKLRTEVFDAFEKNFEKIYTLIDADTLMDIKQERDSFKKIDMMVTGLNKSIDAAKHGKVDQTEAIKALEKTRDELLGKIKTINSEREEEKAKLLEGFEKEKEESTIHHSLISGLSKFELGKEHTALKDSIFSVIITDLKANNALKIDKTNGQIGVFNADGSPKFEGNTQVTIDKLLEAKISPYVKRNNAGDSPNNPPTNGKGDPQRRTPPADPNSMTLAQRRLAAYQE